MRTRRGEAERLTSALHRWWANEHDIFKRGLTEQWAIERNDGVYLRVVTINNLGIKTTLDKRAVPVSLGDLRTLINRSSELGAECEARLTTFFHEEPTHFEEVLTPEMQLIARVREIVLDDGVGAGLRMRYLVELLK